MHCHGRHSAHLRHYHDIDLFGLRRDYKNVLSVFKEFGYSHNVEFNFYHGEERLQFVAKERAGNVDVFLDKFVMDHTLDFRSRIRLDDFTIPITDLLMTKLQMEKREGKDMQDIVAILEDHDLGHSDHKEALNVDHMADVCSEDWGLCKTVSGSLQNVVRAVEDDVTVQCVGMEAAKLTDKINVIRDSISSRKKALRWNARDVLGERIRW